jgi:hypothetical protein
MTQVNNLFLPQEREEPSRKKKGKKKEREEPLWRHRTKQLGQAKPQTRSLTLKVLAHSRHSTLLLVLKKKAQYLQKGTAPPKVYPNLTQNAFVVQEKNSETLHFAV